MSSVGTMEPEGSLKGEASVERTSTTKMMAGPQEFQGNGFDFAEQDLSTLHSRREAANVGQCDAKENCEALLSEEERGKLCDVDVPTQGVFCQTTLTDSKVTQK